MAEVIDAFGHIMPQSVYERLRTTHPTDAIEAHSETYFYDIDQRLADLDEYDIDKQVLTLASPPSWLGIGSQEALPIVKHANNEIRRIADEYPDQFVPVATLPFLTDEYLDEFDRCINDLGMAGVQIFSNIDGRPLDDETFLPFFEMADSKGIPLWMHPQLAEYGVTGDSLFYDKVFGWLLDTSVALSRLVFSGVMEKCPNLNLIAHHMCAMVPHFAARIETFYQAREFYPHADWADLSRPVEDYFKRFYGDTVLNGSVAALETGYDFFGADHLLYGSDYPYGPDHGRKWLGDTESIRQMDLTDDELDRILGGNMERLISL